MNQDLPDLPDADDAHGEQAAIGAASFILSLRAKGIRDTALLRSMELVPREVFAPRRFTDLARTDVAPKFSRWFTLESVGRVRGAKGGTILAVYTATRRVVPPKGSDAQLPEPGCVAE